MTHRLAGVLATIATALSAAAAQAGAPPGYLSGQGICMINNPANFRPADVIEKVKLSYPPKALNEWSEGWVFLEYAVTTSCEVRDISVIDAIGARDFVASSVAAVAVQRFKPALRGGVPVEQFLRNTSISFLFSDTAAKVTHPEFYDRYEVARTRISSSRLDDAIELLERTQQQWRLNLYETAMSSYLLAVAYAKKEDWESARYYIEHAVSEDGAFLNKALKPEAMALLIKLRAQATDFGGALCGFHALSAEHRATMAPLEADIRARLLSEGPLVSDGKLLKHPIADQPGAWRRQLLRRKFSFANVNGEAKSFRLSCVAASLEGPIDPEMQWTVPEQAGSCVIRVLGTPGATFKLVEEW